MDYGTQPKIKSYQQLTPRQHELLGFLRSYYRSNGYMPTMTEMAARMGLAGRTGPLRILRVLEDKKYLVRTKYKCRAIEIIRPVGSR